MGGLEEADVYIGRKAQELRGLLKIKYPVEHGIVSHILRRSQRQSSSYSYPPGHGLGRHGDNMEVCVSR